MKIVFRIVIILIVLLVGSYLMCTTEQLNYNKIITDYLETKKIEPTITYRISDETSMFKILNHQIHLNEGTQGIEIIIDGDTINTQEKVTLNAVWGSRVNRVNFANILTEIKIYKAYSLMSFLFSNYPCTGLGCGVNFQMIYDLKTKRQSYFGRFRTGFEMELYHFNSDDNPDFLSKTFYGRNSTAIDTTEFIMYSHTKNGRFEIFKTSEQEKFWFKHIYSAFHQDLKNEGFEEHWIENIR